MALIRLWRKDAERKTMLTKTQKLNYADFLAEAIRQLSNDTYWTNELRTEYQVENNLPGFAPIHALQNIRKHLLEIQ
jgi:hypothetical protein